MDQLTIHAVTHPTREVSVSVGTVVLHKLVLADYPACLQLWGNLLQAVAILLGREPDEDEVRERMAMVLADTLGHPIGREAVLQFFGFFVDPHNAGRGADGAAFSLEGMLGLLSLDDVAALWDAIWGMNAVPFVHRHQQMRALGTYAAVGAEWGRARMTLQNVDGLGSLYVPESTLASEDLLPSTPSASQKSSKSSKSGTQRG